MLYIVWVWPSNSDHQDDITCLIGDPELNLHLPLLLGGHTQDIVMFGLELVYQFGMRVTPKNRIEGIVVQRLLGWHKGHYMTPTQTSCTIIGKIPPKLPTHLHQSTSWWFFTNPSEKYAIRRQIGKIFPNFRGENSTSPSRQV